MDAFDVLAKKWSVLFQAFQVDKSGVTCLHRILENTSMYTSMFGLSSDDQLRLLQGAETGGYLAAKCFGLGKVTLTMDEFREACANFILKKPRTFTLRWQQFFHAMFNVLDRNTDGYISLDELKMFYQHTALSENVALIVYKALEKNPDDKMSREEFVDTYTKFYCDADVPYEKLPIF